MNEAPASSPEQIASAPKQDAVQAAAGARGGLVRNTFYLTAAQAVTIPVSVLSNALIGRYLGSEEFGHLYLATTMCTFALLGVEWGQSGALPALVARDRAQAAEYLGSSLVWRLLLALVMAGVLATACWLLGYDSSVRWAVALAFPLALLNSYGQAFKDTFRGFERTDVPAFAHVAQQLMMAATIVPVLMLGGHLRALLLSYIVVAIVTVFFLRRSLRPLGLGALRFAKSNVKALVQQGTPFVFFGLAMVLGPNINATFLAKLVPAEVVGWFGVSQRLIGLLIFPASALVGALYPTLCRLQAENQEDFVRTSRSALYGVSLLAIPAAVGCGIFPELGVAIFGSQEFSGAEAHLQVMSAFVFLVYFSMPLGTSILAANKQKIWALVQCICLVVSLLGNPFLVPYFQRTTGNGALGTCVTLVLSELLVVACGIALSERGLFDRHFGKSLLLAAGAGAAMASVGLLLKPASLFLAVPAALLTYAGLAWFSGAIQPSTSDMIKRVISRKLSRAS
jgi:O-antigen/teichoic acid export membrane protein